MKNSKWNEASNERELLKIAFDQLSEIADRDCNCEYEDSSPTAKYKCDTCQTRQARLNIARVLDPKLESAQPNRMRNAAERIWVEEYRRENASHYDDDPLFTLRATLATDKELKEAQKRGPGARFNNDITARDAQVATSVIQWLGTACGASFVRRCQLEVGAALGNDSARKYNVYLNDRDETEFEVAKAIAANFISNDTYPEVVESLANTIVRNFSVRSEAVGKTTVPMEV